MGLNWVHREMLGCNTPEDVDAFLAGREIPSKKAEQENRIATLLAAGGEMR